MKDRRLGILRRQLNDEKWIYVFSAAARKVQRERVAELKREIRLLESEQKAAEAKETEGTLTTDDADGTDKTQ